MIAAGKLIVIGATAVGTYIAGKWALHNTKPGQRVLEKLHYHRIIKIRPEVMAEIARDRGRVINFPSK